MEVRIEADGCELPEGSCICVRIGDVQKQTAYDPKKVYRFPEARRFGKIDLYQRVGTCEIQWGLDEPESRTCRLVNSTGDVGACLKVKMSRPPATPAKSAITEPQTVKPNSSQYDETADKAKVVSAIQLDEAAAKAKEVSVRAKAYLLDHDIEGIFTNAMRSLLRAMPEDPAGFLRDHIGLCYSPRPNKQTPVAKRIEPLPVTTRPACLGPTFNAYYRKHILLSEAPSFLPDFHARASWQAPPRQAQPARASEDGTLQEAMREVTGGGEELFGSSDSDENDKNRRQARDALVAAHTNGTLQNAMRQRGLGLLRERARDVLVKACRDARLPTAWTEIRCEALRTKFQDLFLNSSSNGNLDDALAQLRRVTSGEEVAANIASADSQSSAFAELRAQAAQSFGEAVQEGKSEKKLREILDENTEKVEEQSPRTPASPSGINKKARKNLLEGLKKGTLEALVDTMEVTEKENATGEAPTSSQGIADLPARIASCLDAALKSGELAAARPSPPAEAPVELHKISLGYENRTTSKEDLQRWWRSVMDSVGVVDKEEFKSKYPSYVQRTYDKNGEDVQLADVNNLSEERFPVTFEMRLTSKSKATSPRGKSSASSSASAINKKARKNLLEGLKKGTLEALVVDMEATEEENSTADAPMSSQASRTADLAASREHARKVLLEACEGGQLVQALQTIAEPWESDLTRTRTNLLNAAADGSLAQLIVAKAREEKTEVQSLQEETVPEKTQGDLGMKTINVEEGLAEKIAQKELELPPNSAKSTPVKTKKELQIGDQVEVYSQSVQHWCPGVITKVWLERAEPMVTVEYHHGHDTLSKEITTDHEHLRIASSQIQQDNGTRNNDIA